MSAVRRQRVARADRLRLQVRWGYQSGDLDVYGFNRGRPLRDAEHYLGYDWYLRRIRPLLNAPWAKPLTESKWVFYRLLESFGLPGPSTLGLFDSMHGVTWEDQRPMQTVPQVLEELERRRPGGLVLKPVGGVQGKQLLILDTIDYSTGRAVTRAGGETSLEESLAGLDLAGMRGYSGYILQEPLPAHEVFERLAPWTTNTVRVQTILSADGAVHVLATVARLGRRGSMVDNWEQGGVSVAIDSATGVLGRGVLKTHEWYTSHPDTGVPLAGVTVPFWDEVLQVCRRGARLFPGLRALGWDIVITPDGPVVLEANSDFGIRVIQVHTDGFLADPVFRERMADLGVPLPDGAVGTRDAAGRVLSRAQKRFAR